MKRWLLLLIPFALGLCVTEPAFAQSGSLYSNTAYRYTPAGIFPATTASVQICTSTATGQPCTPTVTVYSDAALSLPVANPLAACTVSPQVGCIDGFGNFSFYAAQGAYTYTVTGSGLTSYGPTAFGLSCVAGVTCVSASANNAFTGANTMGKLNAVRYVDGVQFTTIDLAVADCGATPCTVVIPSTYAGAESSHLVTSTLGYIFYKPVANETVIDNRYATGTSRPNYSYSFNGQNLGQLSRFGVTQSCASAVDSCVGATITNFISGTMPANNGTQTGMVSIAAVTGSITRGASGARVVAHEGYVSLSATSADTPFSDVRGFTSSINIDRATSVQGCVTCAAYTAAAHTNISTSGATIVNAYGFDGQVQSAGTSRNYSFHSQGNMLFENAQAVHAVDSGGVAHPIILFRSDNGIDLFSLADGQPISIKTQGGAGAFRVIPNASISSFLTHQFTLSATPASAGGAVLGLAALPWSSLFYGAVATNNAQLTGTFTAARTHTGPDASGTLLLSGNGDGTHAIKNQSVRFSGVLGGTCPTAAAIGAPCTSGNINWTTSFGDNSYAVVCTLNGTLTGQPHIVGTTYQAGGVGITITIAADTAVAANVAAAGFTHCIAIHD